MKAPKPCISLRVYGLLLRLYPKGFRQEYGEEMAHLFEDQCRGAAGLPNPTAELAKLWLRTAGDVAVSAIVQHINNIGDKMNERQFGGLIHEWSFGRLVAAIATILALVCILTTVFFLPRAYQSMVRLDITKGEMHGRETDALGNIGPAMYDPYFIQTAFEKIQSRKVLEQVFNELKLGEWLGQAQGFGRPLTFSESYPILISMIDLRQSRNTSLVEIRVYSLSNKVSARIANKIAEVFARTASPGLNAVVVDSAMPDERPVRPNVPLNIAGGTILSILAGLVIAAVLKLIWRNRRVAGTA